MEPARYALADPSHRRIPLKARPRLHLARLQPLAALLALALAGCGSSTSPPVPVNPTLATLPGDWYFSFGNADGSNPIDGLLGALSVQGSTVNGVFRINDPQHSPPCLPATQDIVFTGTLDADNLLALTSAPFAGSVATLRVQLPLAKGTAQGTGQIVGPVCAFASLPLLAEFVPGISGTYTGSLALNPNSLQPGPTGPATIVLSEASANSDGQFPVTGTLVYASSNCTLSTTISGILTGPFLNLQAAIPGIVFEGIVSNPPTGFTAASADLNVPPQIQGCATGFYGGPLPRQ